MLGKRSDQKGLAGGAACLDVWAVKAAVRRKFWWRVRWDTRFRFRYNPACTKTT